MKIPFFLSKESKTNEIIICTDKLKEGEAKIVRIWSWNEMRSVAYAISLREGQISIVKIG